MKLRMQEQTGRILLDLGALAQADRSMAEAEKFYLRAIAECEKEPLGQQTPLTIALLRLGHLYEEEERFDQAEQLFKRVLQIVL